MYTIESASLRPVSKHYREIILKQDLWANRIDKYMYKETKIRILMTRFFTDGFSPVHILKNLDQH